MTSAEFVAIREELREIRKEFQALAVSVAACQGRCTYDHKDRRDWKMAVVGALLAIGAGIITKKLGG